MQNISSEEPKPHRSVWWSNKIDGDKVYNLQEVRDKVYNLQEVQGKGCKFSGFTCN